MQEQREDDQRGRRIAVGGGIVALILILIALLWALKDGTSPPTSPETAPTTAAAASGEGTPGDAAAPPPAPPAAPATPPATAVTPAEAPAPVPPSFDVARIAPDGTAVLAGRTPAGSTVDVLGNGAAIGSAKGEGGDGAWVLVVDKPLPEGTLELSLVAIMPDGSRIPSTEVVLVDVPARAKPPAPAEGGGETAPATPPAAVAVVTERDPGTGTATTRILQGPDDGAPAPTTPGGDVTLDLVEYGDDGAPILSGHAPAGATVRLYLDGAALAEGPANQDGTWRVIPEKPVAPGRYLLRLDAVDGAGKVVARRELPFERARIEQVVRPAGEAGEARPSRFTVQPGNSLWRIARSHLGTGYRYIDLYRANSEQIRDPNLIYPGQILDLPPP